MIETTRKRASANYALEVYGDKTSAGADVWFETQDGFVSPEAAIAYAKTERIQGILRVIRVASPLYGGDVVTPEPVYTLKKLAEESKKPKTRKPKTTRIKDSQEPIQIASDDKFPDSPSVIPLLPETEQKGDLDPLLPDPSERAEELYDSNT